MSEHQPNTLDTVAFTQKLCANKQPHDWETCEHCHYLVDTLDEWEQGKLKADQPDGPVPGWSHWDVFVRENVAAKRLDVITSKLCQMAVQPAAPARYHLREHIFPDGVCYRWKWGSKGSWRCKCGVALGGDNLFEAWMQHVEGG